MRLLNAFLIIFLLHSAIVFSATQTISVVEGSTPEPEKTTWQILKPFVIGGVLILLLLGGIVWLIIWLVKKIREGKDVWYKIMKDKIHLCRMHKDSSRVRGFFRFSKSNPIKLYNVAGTRINTRTIGYYRGHYTSRDGNIIIMFAFRRKWWVFPKNDLLIINSKDTIKIPKKVVKQVGNRMESITEYEEVKIPKNIVSFNEGEIIINAHSIDMDYRTEFFIPVLKDTEGNVINMSLPTYESMKQVAIEGYLYDQTDDFVKVAKKSIDLNPTIRGLNKVSDSSSSIDTQPANIKQ